MSRSRLLCTCIAGYCRQATLHHGKRRGRIGDNVLQAMWCALVKGGLGFWSSGGSISVLTMRRMLLATAAVTTRDAGMPTMMTSIIFNSAAPADPGQPEILYR